MSTETQSTVAKTSNSPDSVTKMKLQELLKGVVAYVDVRLEKKDASDCVANELVRLGATVVEYFVPEVTHLVFFEGYRRSYKAALRRKIHIVAPHWISDSKANLCKQEVEKYIPDMPPPKEEVPFFRKRRFKPMVDEIVAGTYIRAEDRDPNYFRDKILQSLSKKLNSRNGTPKNGTTPRTGGRKMKQKLISDDFDTSNSEPIGQLLAETLKKIQEKNKDDKYAIWVDSPATTTGDDDDDGYIPLFERCKARLLAEHKLKQTEERIGSWIDKDKDTVPTSESHTSTSSLATTQEAAASQISDANVSEDSQKSRKRKSSLDPRPNKRAKLDQMSPTDKPKEKRGRGRPRKIRYEISDHSHSEAEFDASLISQPTDDSFQVNPTDINDSFNNTSAEIIPSVQSLSLNTLKISRGRKSISNSKLSNDSTVIGRSSLKGRLKPTLTQPVRKSRRLTMRVQLSLDKFLLPKEQDGMESMPQESFIPEAQDESPMISGEGYNAPQTSEETAFSSSPNPERLAATNLHEWEKEFLVSTMKNIGGMKMVEEIREGETLVVSGNGRRTVKILFGVAFGCWVVGFDWVIESAKHRMWMDVRDFEVVLFPAAVESRMERLRSNDNYSMNLFSSCGGIFVSNGCKPSKEKVELLIKICRGRLVNNLRKADICVGEVLRRAVKNVDVKWVLDSISGNLLLDMDSYLLI